MMHHVMVFFFICVGGGAGGRGRGVVTRGGGMVRGGGVGASYTGARTYSGVMRPDKSHNRYNPIGLGGGYNMYNWN